MATMDEVKAIIVDVLQISDRKEMIDASTQLLGGIPEFDSMAVVSVITAIEEQFDIEIDDDELEADVFETLGALQKFVADKI